MSQIDDPKVSVDDGDGDGPDVGATTTGSAPVTGSTRRRRTERNGSNLAGRSGASAAAENVEAGPPADEGPSTPSGRHGSSGSNGSNRGDDATTTTTEVPEDRGDEGAPDDDLDLDLDDDGSVGLLDVELDDDPALDGSDGADASWDDEVAAPVRTQSRHRKRKEWRQSERARRYAARRSVRFPIFTRSVLLWALLFAMTGAAFGGSGAFFWAHFNTEISELSEQTTDFDKRSQEARAEIDAMRNQAVTDINNQLRPIAPFLAEANTIKQAETVSPYVWFVATLDENGNPAVGSAFSVVTDDSTTLMITSYNTVRATSVLPAPPLGVRKGQEEIPATLVSFDADRDLALIEVQRANMPVLEWASDEEQAAALGLRVFPVSGLGGSGASLTSGIIIDQSAAGILHTAPVGNFMQGGPIITADYKVLGVASTTYRPLGFDPGEIHYAVQINSVCAVLMECGGGARTRAPN